MQKSKIKNQNYKSKFKNYPAAAGYRNFAFCVLRFDFKRGFTLLEMVISIGIFSVLVTAAIGITIGVSNAYLKSANVQATQDNIRFSVELMTKELRTGYAYDVSGRCGAEAAEAVSFIGSDDRRRVYYRDGAGIRRIAFDASDTGDLRRQPNAEDCRSARPLLADEVAVERLRFTAGGEAAGPSDGQPWVMVGLSVRSRSGKQSLESRMDLQTTVVQRLRDL